MGVADGVGSWTFEQGVDAARFSRKLASAAADGARQYLELREKNPVVRSLPLLMSQRAARFRPPVGAASAVYPSASRRLVPYWPRALVACIWCTPRPV